MNFYSISHLGISQSRFHAENLVMPGVEMSPLYLDWLGLASVDIRPALLPRRAEEADAAGAAKFLMSVGPGQSSYHLDQVAGFDT